MSLKQDFPLLSVSFLFRFMFGRPVPGKIRGRRNTPPVSSPGSLPIPLTSGKTGRIYDGSQITGSFKMSGFVACFKSILRRYGVVFMTRNELNAQTKKRDPFFDNARFILVALVVLGHLISPGRQESDVIYYANNFLGSFRMPALILITGYFSKRFYKEGFITKITLAVLVPYLIFQSIYSLMNDVLYNHDEFMINIFSPSYAMWFLLSLYFWNIMLFVFSKMKHPIIIAFIIGIGIGWLDNAGHYLSVSRTFVFFPFFLIGHYLKPGHFEWVKKDKAKIFSIIAVVISFSIMFNFGLYEARTYLLAKYPYTEIASSYLAGSGIRMVFYIVMFCGILAFLPWMPKKETFFTKLGRRTAYIYILHIFFMKLLRGADLSYEIQTWHFFAVPIVWLAITFFVSSNLVVRLTRPLIEGRIAAPLFKDASSQKKKAAEQETKQQHHHDKEARKSPS